jgi:hypothetical protein
LRFGRVSKDEVFRLVLPVYGTRYGYEGDCFADERINRLALLWDAAEHDQADGRIRPFSSLDKNGEPKLVVELGGYSMMPLRSGDDIITLERFLARFIDNDEVLGRLAAEKLAHFFPRALEKRDLVGLGAVTSDWNLGWDIAERIIPVVRKYLHLTWLERFLDCVVEGHFGIGDLKKFLEHNGYPENKLSDKSLAAYWSIVGDLDADHKGILRNQFDQAGLKPSKRNAETLCGVGDKAGRLIAQALNPGTEE